LAQEPISAFGYLEKYENKKYRVANKNAQSFQKIQE
jgi:hypothetical protein